MLNSKQVMAVIREIAANPSKNVKKASVKALAKDATAVRVFSYAYDPFKTYGFIPQAWTDTCPNGEHSVFDEKTWQLLDDMIARKLTGNAARVAFYEEVSRLDDDSAELLWRIVRKDLRAGFGESTINKAIKGLIPTFPYQRCSLPKDVELDEWPWETGVFSQLKADGMFANVDHELSGNVAVRSRQGSEFPIERFQRLVAAVQACLPNGFQYHGEIVVLRDGKVLNREIGNGIMNSVLSGGSFAENEQPQFQVWDMIPLDKIVAKGKHTTPYSVRIKMLLLALKTNTSQSLRLIETRVVKSKADAYRHAAQLMRDGYEGTVVKHPNAIWKDGTSKEQVKLKLEFDVDLKIVGIADGRIGTKNEGRAGALNCVTSDGLLEVDVAIKNEAMRDAVDADRDAWVGKVVTVIANDVMLPSPSSDKHSLFLPRLQSASWRTDKTEADSLSRVVAAKELAILGKQIVKELT